MGDRSSSLRVHKNPVSRFVPGDLLVKVGHKEWLEPPAAQNVFLKAKRFFEVLGCSCGFPLRLTDALLAGPSVMGLMSGTVRELELEAPF